MNASTAGSLLARVVAHQGGWDEILLVVGPLAVVALALWLANRRALAQIEQDRALEDEAGFEVPDRADGPS